MRTFAAALLSMVLVACAAPTDEPVTAPTPYTADQIRAANPVGTVLVYRIQQTGTPTVVRTMEFVRDDPNGARITSLTVTEGGAPMDTPTDADALWTELRDHAVFPAARTVRSRRSCTVPGGSFECMLYTVTAEEEGIPTLSRYWFALRRPGPPVLLETEKGGVVVFRMELMDVRRADAE